MCTSANKMVASLYKHMQHLNTCVYMFDAYRSSWVLPAIIKRDTTAAGHTKSTPPMDEQMNALHTAVDAVVLSRVFLDSLDPYHYEEFTRGIKNAPTKGRNIYSIDVAEALDRVEKFIVPRRSGATNDCKGLVFTTTATGRGHSTH